MKAKLLVVGPCQSGKTFLCNFLSDATEGTKEYAPTKGVRILEFESEFEGQNTERIDVELWDCSGDRKYENCWPTMWQGTLGVVIVYNLGHPHSQAREMDRWYSMFVSQQGLSANKCLLISNSRTAITDPQPANPLPSYADKVKHVQVKGKENLEDFRKEFNVFLHQVVTSQNDLIMSEDLI